MLFRSNKKVMEYIPEPYGKAFQDHCHMALNGIPIQIEREIKFHKDMVWSSCTYVPACDTEGNIIGVIFSAININSKVELEKKIDSLDQSLREIAYIQSHELRRPVASILGLMNLFKTQDYVATREELKMMEIAVNELDEKIHMIVNCTY